MPREQRRIHLLEAAAEIARTEGTEALTLARVAQQSGVTKPVAYQHFGTRSGLLIALYHQLGVLHTEAATAALRGMEDNKVDMPELMQVLSRSFVDCVLENGALYGAISAALAGTVEMGDFRQAVRDEYVDHYQTAIAPFVDMPPRKRRLLLMGFLGAAEILSEAAVRGSITRIEAITTLAEIACCSFQACAVAGHYSGPNAHARDERKIHSPDSVRRLDGRLESR